MKIHPAAEIFPMMSPDELKELAADIVTNGLMTPIVVDAEGVLIDGRNRLAACKMAGVEPTFSNLNGHDPLAFILSANIARRHMTKGQQAMATAMLYPEAKQGGDRRSSLKIKHDVNRGSLSQARTVLAHAPELAQLVMDGSKSLSDAHEIVRQRLNDATSDEAKMAQLREKAPDIAELVVEGKISLAAAMAELAERDRQERQAREFSHKCAEAIETEVINRVVGIRHGLLFGERMTIGSDKVRWLAGQLNELAEAMEGTAQ